MFLPNCKAGPDRGGTLPDPLAHRRTKLMRTRNQCSSPSKSTPPSVFSPDFLERISRRDEAITAAEAEFAGPWKIEPDETEPGSVAVLRAWESLAAGDRPEAVFWHRENAVL